MSTLSKERIIEIFKGPDTEAKIRFIEQCPHYNLKDQALMMVRLNSVESPTMALSSLASGYARSFKKEDYKYGALLGYAGYELALETSRRNDIPSTSRETIRSNAASSAHACIKSLFNLGKPEAAGKFSRQVLPVLESFGEKDTCFSIMLEEVEYLLLRQEYHAAKQLVSKLENYDTNDFNPADKMKLFSARQKINEKLGRITDTDRPDETIEDELTRKRNETVASGIDALSELLGDDTRWIGEALKDRFEEEKENKVDENQILDSAAKMQQMLKEIMSGKSALDLVNDERFRPQNNDSKSGNNTKE